jgi:type I restriction enzyme S subunit
MRHIARLFAGGTPDRKNPSYWEAGTIPWLNSGAVNQWIITRPSHYITEAGYQNSSAKLIPKGALVMALAGQGKTKGMVAQLGIDSTCNQSMAAIVPKRDVAARFLLWWLNANYESIRSLAGGELRDGLNLDILGDIPCPVPTLAVQRRIVYHLDRETSRSDALIAAKRRMIELIAEREREALTLTIEGLTCERRPLRWFVRVGSGEGLGPHDLDPEGGTPVYGGNGIMGYTFRQPMTLTRSIAVGRVGALCGNVHVIPGLAWITDNALWLRDLRGLDIDYLALVLRAARLNDLADKTAQPLITGETVKNTRVPFPTIAAQREVRQAVAESTRRASAIIQCLTSQIGLLEERRQALVVAAVSGQLEIAEAT